MHLSNRTCPNVVTAPAGAGSDSEGDERARCWLDAPRILLNLGPILSEGRLDALLVVPDGLWRNLLEAGPMALLNTVHARLVQRNLLEAGPIALSRSGTGAVQGPPDLI